MGDDTLDFSRENFIDNKIYGDSKILNTDLKF